HRAVRIANLAEVGSGGDVDELTARWKHGNTRAWERRDAGVANFREDAEFDGSDDRASVDDRIAGLYGGAAREDMLPGLEIDVVKLHAGIVEELSFFDR